MIWNTLSTCIAEANSEICGYIVLKNAHGKTKTLLFPIVSGLDMVSGFLVFELIQFGKGQRFFHLISFSPLNVTCLTLASLFTPLIGSLEIKVNKRIWT